MQETAQEKKRKRLLGTIILGRLNCFVFGLLFLIISLAVYFRVTPQDFDQVIDAFKASGLPFEISLEQFKLAIALNSSICLIFFISGVGLLLQREWARKLTIYFSLLMVILTFVAVITQPAFIAQAVLQVVYPGILIFYFTNKKVEKHFVLMQRKS